jgi:hypothetical protein
MVEETFSSTAPPQSSRRFLTFLKRPKTDPNLKSPEQPISMAVSPVEPLQQSQPRQKLFNAGKWIDEHFDMLQKAPKRTNTSVAGPSNPLSSRKFNTPLRTPTIETEDWIIVPRQSNRTFRTITQRSRTMGKAVTRGWDRVVIIGSSVGNIVVSRVPKRKKVEVVDQDIIRPEAQATVREVMAGTAPERDEAHSIAESVSEQFHTEDEIMEAEPVRAEETG